MGAKEMEMRVAIGCRGTEETATGIVSGRRACGITRQKGVVVIGVRSTP